ncbi:MULTISPECIES: NUDIX hydrolase [unclassified Streptococcus]|uniref:NUDIX hydrolase n=1 Tax=unclassified Streptococcus TaxID=2608887 RepID=UPI00066FFF12|nr:MULTISPECIES: NUDIX hydrolase [unclassified Streptococcus]
MYQIGDIGCTLSNPTIRHATRGVVINEKNEMIILIYKKYHFSVLPDGGLYKGESPEVGFRREVFEETGFDCQIIATLPTIEGYRASKNLIQYHHAFFARITSFSGPQQLDDGEIADGIDIHFFHFFKECHTSLNKRLKPFSKPVFQNEIA